MMDAVDAIMAVMEAAFDPAYGEGWTHRQVSDALTFPRTHFIILDADGAEPESPGSCAGFTLSRQIADEEELLLIAVSPQSRGRGVGHALMARFIAEATARGSSTLFLEMRDGNPAERLYRAHGFSPVGRRPNYYRTGQDGPFDAVTYSRSKI